MKILFVGDVMLGRLVNEVLKQKPPEYPWGDTLSIFRNADIRICNLECVISDKGAPWSSSPKVFHFRTDAKNIETLKKAQINVVSLANNHALDFEYEAMFEMFKILDAAGINYTGAGGNIKEAYRSAILEVGGVKVGFISFTDNEPSWGASSRSPGIFFVPINTKDRRAKKLLDLVSKTKKETDLLIVSAHWGPNWGYRPNAHHIPFAHALVDSGADIIFGHSGHVFQGVEIYKHPLPSRSKGGVALARGSLPSADAERKGIIIYSAGDFIDDYAVDEIERNDQSFIFLVEARDRKMISLQLYPTVIREFQARSAKRGEAKEFVEKMQDLCSEFATTSKWYGKELYLEILL